MPKLCKQDKPYVPGLPGHKHPCEIWIKRGGGKTTSNSSTVGRKGRPYYVAIRAAVKFAMSRCWHNGQPITSGNCAKKWRESRGG